MAKKLGQTGKVTVRFTLNKDGSLSATEVIDRSAYDILNRAAEDLVKSINGIKPFPEEIKKVSWEITVPIEYSLN
ncbi:Gram-negative bacterial tonB protein [compost metagenome]